jgi:microsomal dipeptidase-like Zn-dependent dipeptidase
VPAIRFPQVVDLHNDLLTESCTSANEHGPVASRALVAAAARWRCNGSGSLIFTEDYFVGEGALRRCLMILDGRGAGGRARGKRRDLPHGRDLDATTESGRIALILALEGLEPVGADLGVLRTLYRLGVRVASLTWNRRTMFADAGEAATKAV